MRGDPSGPLRDACKNWRYSRQDTVSRRLTTTTGLAVDPPLTEIYLAPVTDVDGEVLPIQVALAGLDVASMGMDVVFFLDARCTQSVDINQWASGKAYVRWSV